MTGFDVRLVAHAPNGPRLGVLPTPLSVEVGVPLDDVGSLRLSYAAGAPGAALLGSPVEVAVETYNPDTGAWAEIDGARFLRIKRSGNLTDPTGARAFELPAYAWLLRKARLYPSSFDNAEGKRPFPSATPGTILATLLMTARGRGALPGLTIDFGPSEDSAGQPWAKVLTIAYEPGIDVYTVLDNLAEQGVIDWTTAGRTLRVFNADTALGRDLATGDTPVDLRLGRDIVDAPDTATLEDLANAVYVKGDGAARLELVNPDAPTPWGRFEGFISQGGVRDEGTMRLLAEAELDRTGRERVQITRGLVAGRWAPFRDYRPGDYVLAPDDTGTLAPLRVQQITITRDQAGAVTGNVVLNDRFVERELRLAKRTAGILGGASADGGSGARPAPEGPDPRQPAAPAGLIVASTAYLDSDGAARGQITATWGTVDTAVDGTAIEVAGYDVHQRPNTVGVPWAKLTETTHPDNTATASPYDVGAQWAFRVRAISRAGVLGPFSAVSAVTIAADADPPPTPSAPVLSTRLGVIHVEWNGQGAQGETMPPDFSHLDVWMSTGTGDPLRVNRMEGAGSVVVTDQPYNTTRTFWFTTLDRSGNTSPASPAQSIATQPLVGGDLIGTVIRGDHIVANSVTADRLAVGSVTASAIAANAVTADKLTATAIDGRTITGATVRTSPDNPRVQLDADGLHAFNSAGARTVEVSAATGAATVTGTFQTGTSGKRVRIDPEITAGRPGIVFETGSSAYPNPPSLFTDADGEQEGILWMSSAERVLNNTGRAEIQLYPGGGWRIGKAFGDTNTAVSLNAPGDGRLHIDGILPRGMTPNRMLGFGITHINPGAFSVRIDHGATVTAGSPVPHCTIVTGAPQDGVTWGVTRWDNRGFQFNWSKGVEIDIHWLIIRSA